MSPFELKSSAEGRGAFATEKIRSGFIIFRERPTFFLNMSPDKDPEDALREIYFRMSIQTRQKFDALRTRPAILDKLPEDHIMTGKFRSNSFYDNTTNQWSCYPISCRFNHSCLPNSVAVLFAGDVFVLATRNLLPGEEITYVYDTYLQYMTTEERDAVLRKRFGGKGCPCPLCSLPADQRYLSDLRRFLMRRLLAMLSGMDLRSMPVVITDIKRTLDYKMIIWQSVLVAELGAAEKVYAGPLPHIMYIYAASLYIKRAYTERWKKIPCWDVWWLMVWVKKAEDAIQAYTMENYLDNTELTDCWRFLCRLRKEDRKLPGLEGLKLFRNILKPLKFRGG